MSTPRLLRSGPMLALLVAVVVFPATAADDPIVTMRSEAELEIDLGMVMEDMMPSIMEIIAAEDEQGAYIAETVLELSGLPALDRLKMQSRAGDDGFHCQGRISLDMSKNGGLLGALFSVKPGSFAFGRYLNSDDFVAAISLSSIGERVLALNDFASRPEMRQLAPMLPADPLAMTQMWGFNAREDILPYLRELDVILFPFREGQDVNQPNIAIVLGLTDGPAFRDEVFGILTNIVGEEKIAPIRDAEGETVGEFTFYPLPEGASYAVGTEFAVMTSDAEGLKSLVTRRGGGMSGLDGNFYLRINTDALLDMVNRVVEQQGGEEAWAAMILGALAKAGEKPIGPIEMTTKATGDAWEWKASLPRELITAEYLLLKEMLQGVPVLQAAERRRGGLRSAVGEVDAALTRYGEEHEGVFPATLQGLVDAGYIDAVPSEVMPTALGQYVDGGYTYVPVADDAGTIAGYYFIVYGMGEGTGFDLLTPENLGADTFHAARDGVPDGIVSYAYGGTEIPHVQSMPAN